MPTERLLLATPLHAPTPVLAWHKCVKRMMIEFSKAGIRFDTVDCFGDSMVHRPRNQLAALLLYSDFTHVFWLDADMAIAPHHVIRMLDADLPIVGVNYPQKRYLWENLVGKTIESEAQLRAVLLQGTVQPLDEGTSVDCRGMWKVKRVGGGATLVRREVYETIQSRGLVEPITVHNDLLPAARPFHHRFYYPKMVDGADLGEDFIFCDLAREAGFDVWYDPRAHAEHWGMHRFAVE